MIPRILDTLFLSVPHLAGDDVRQRSEERRRYRFYPRHPRGWRRRQPPKATFRQPCFYPRHPRGWRRYNDKNTPKGVNGFYPRHPRGWRLYEQRARTLGTKVSIHATLAGGDVFARCAAIAVHSFYPRHPRGWRPLSAPPVMAAFLFLSTPPSRVATIVTGDG